MLHMSLCPVVKRSYKSHIEPSAGSRSIYIQKIPMIKSKDHSPMMPKRLFHECQLRSQTSIARAIPRSTRHHERHLLHHCPAATQLIRLRQGRWKASPSRPRVRGRLHHATLGRQLRVQHAIYERHGGSPHQSNPFTLPSATAYQHPATPPNQIPPKFQATTTRTRSQPPSRAVLDTASYPVNLLLET